MDDDVGDVRWCVVVVWDAGLGGVCVVMRVVGSWWCGWWCG